MTLHMSIEDTRQSITNNLAQAYTGRSIREVIKSESDARLFAIQHNLPRPPGSKDWRLDISLYNWPELLITQKLRFALLSDTQALIEFEALLNSDYVDAGGDSPEIEYQHKGSENFTVLALPACMTSKEWDAWHVDAAV